MADSTMTLTFTDIQAEVGHFLGYSRTYGGWSTVQTATVAAIIKSGLRQFYFQAGHDWSFLKPLTTLTLFTDLAITSGITVSGGAYTTKTTVTASAAAFCEAMLGRSIVITGVGTFTIITYTSTTVVVVSGDASGASADTFSITSGGNAGLPDNFGGMEGRFSFAPTTGSPPIVQRGEGEIRRLRQASTGSDRPQCAAIVPRAHDANIGQRFDVMFWPAWNDAYVLEYRKRVQMDVISSSDSYAYGGALHSETILESCLAIAEQREDDAAGVHTEKYEKLMLPRSIALDARMAPEFLGENATDPDVLARHTDPNTYEGVEYE